MYDIRRHVYVNERRFFLCQNTIDRIKNVLALSTQWKISVLHLMIHYSVASTKQYFSYIQDKDSFDKLFVWWCLTPPSTIFQLYYLIVNFFLFIK
jgi:hypothetical protein